MTNVKTEGNIHQNAEKITNIEKAGVVNNNYYSKKTKSNKKIFNKIFINELILGLKKDLGNRFPERLSFVDTKNWTNNPDYLGDALTYMASNFISVIGEDIRVLYIIGNKDRYNDESIRINDYINRSIRTYRSSLQLMNYIFISKLWDEKTINKDKNIDTDKPQIRKFFESKILLSLNELRLLFEELIEIFQSNGLNYPIYHENFEHIEQFLQADSAFNKACDELENLNDFDREKVFDTNHLETTEKSLGTILSSFIFFTKYKLLSIRKIEYSESRNSIPQYYKDIKVIGLNPDSSADKKIAKMESLIDHVSVDPTKPQITNSIFLHGPRAFINLFPFLIDCNALTDAEGFLLYFYDCLEGRHGIRYFCAKEGEKEIVPYVKAEALEKKEERDEVKVKEFREETLKELVTKQFSQCMKTLISKEFKFGLEEVLEENTYESSI